MPSSTQTTISIGSPVAIERSSSERYYDSMKIDRERLYMYAQSLLTKVTVFVFLPIQ